MSFSTGSSSLKWRPRLQLYKGANNYFNPTTKEAYSYDWWCYVREIRGKLVFNDHNYSMTTCGHQSRMKSLLEELGLKIDVYVDMRASLDADNFKKYALVSPYQALLLAGIRAKRKGARPDTIRECKAQVVRLRGEIKTLRKLGAQLTKTQIKEMKQALEDGELHRLEAQREANKAKRAMQDKAKQVNQLGVVTSIESILSA